jgi:hypothetical protein
MKKYFTLIIFSLSLLTSNLFAVDNELLDNLLKKNKDLVADGQVRIIKGKFTSKVCDTKKGCKLKDDATGLTYVLNSSQNEWESKQLLKISKTNNEAVIVGFQNWYEQDGKVIIDKTDKGEYVFIVTTSISGKDKYNFEKVTFGAYECGDSCYVRYTDKNGKEKSAYGMLADDQIAMSENLAGQEVFILWYMDKKDKNVVHIQPIQTETTLQDDKVEIFETKGIFIDTKCEDEICDMEFKVNDELLIVSAYNNDVPKLVNGKIYTVVYEKTTEINMYDGGSEKITRMLKDIK